MKIRGENKKPNSLKKKKTKIANSDAVPKSKPAIKKKAKKNVAIKLKKLKKLKSSSTQLLDTKSIDLKSSVGATTESSQWTSCTSSAGSCVLKKKLKLKKVGKIAKKSATTFAIKAIKTEKVLKSGKKKLINQETSTNEADENTQNEKCIRDESSTVFIGNLPVKTTRKDIAKFFESYGPVLSIQLRSCDGKLLLKHSVRKQCGSLIAFVLLKDKETAKEALNLNGSVIKENFVRVTLASKEEIKKEVYDSKDYRKRTVFVGNLSNKDVNDDKLRQLFCTCGDIEYVRSFPNKEMGCGFVCFKRPESVELALGLKNTIVNGRPIRIDRYKLNKSQTDNQKGSPDGRTNAVRIFDLNESTSSEQIKEKLNRFGPIESVEIRNQNNKISALVRFKNPKSAILATKNTFIMINMKSVKIMPILKKQQFSKPVVKVEKKNVYRGKTMSSIKTNQKMKKKKKSNSQMERLATLIAPKAKM